MTDSSNSSLPKPSCPPNIGSFSPETLSRFSKLSFKAIKAGALTFAEYSAALTAELGEMAESLRPLMKQTWERMATVDKRLTPGTEETAVVEPPEKVEASGPTLFDLMPTDTPREEAKLVSTPTGINDPDPRVDSGSHSVRGENIGVQRFVRYDTMLKTTVIVVCSVAFGFAAGFGVRHAFDDPDKFEIKQVEERRKNAASNTPVTYKINKRTGETWEHRDGTWFRSFGH